jgi:17beta-estradiol 17-dehydrogenase / very-long-chain 3-oxoacyl-CoA reductase
MGVDIASLSSAVPAPVQLALAAVGGIFLLGKTLNFLRFVAATFVLPGTNLRKYGKPGTWVVITGASDGLGKEYAQQLAAKGFNIVLISRTQSKLDALAGELESTYKIQTKTLAVDFSRDDDADYARIGELVAPLDVGILLNNVGQSHSIPVPFMLTERNELQNIVTINCLGTLKVTQAVVPAMKQRKKPGLIITMGSFAGWTPTPYLATYSASKAFLQQWSTALAEELRGDKIDVQMALSYLLTGPMAKIRRASLLIPTPKSFVRVTLAKVGSGGWQQVSNTFTPWWTHAIMLYAAETFLGAASGTLIRGNAKAHIDIRTRALRKAAREAKQQ